MQTSPTDQPSIQQGQVPTALEDLSSSIDTLEQLVSALHQSLSTILLPENPVDEYCTVVEPTATEIYVPLARTIRHHTDRLKSLSTSITSILQNLQL